MRECSLFGCGGVVANQSGVQGERPRDEGGGRRSDHKGHAIHATNDHAKKAKALSAGGN